MLGPGRRWCGSGVEQHDPWSARRPSMGRAGRRARHRDQVAPARRVWEAAAAQVSGRHCVDRTAVRPASWGGHRGGGGPAWPSTGRLGWTAAMSSPGDGWPGSSTPGPRRRPAPTASSGFPGAPTLRGTATSRGARADPGRPPPPRPGDQDQHGGPDEPGHDLGQQPASLDPVEEPPLPSRHSAPSRGSKAYRPLRSREMPGRSRRFTLLAHPGPACSMRRPFDPGAAVGAPLRRQNSRRSLLVVTA